MAVLVTKAYNRGCGFSRTAGNVYAASYVSEWLEKGIPLDYFLICPPWVFEDIGQIGLSDQGVMVREASPYAPERKGLWDLWAVVGSGNYTVPDYVTEGEAIGFSWKVPITTPLSLLTQDSVQIMVSRLAHVNNFEELSDDRLNIRGCPRGIAHHDKNEGLEMCTALLWEAVGEPFDAGADRQYDRAFPPKVDPPTFRYPCAAPPANVNLEWEYAAFMWFPITRYEVINDPIESTHEEAVRLLEESGTNIPYAVCTE